MPGMMMHSDRLLKAINTSINHFLVKRGARGLLSVNHFGTGAFTTLDQISEIIIQEARLCQKAAKEMAGIVSGIMHFLGRSAINAAQICLSVLRWAFHLLSHAIEQMAVKAVQLTHS